MLLPIHIFPRERTMGWGIDLAFLSGFDKLLSFSCGHGTTDWSLAHYAYSFGALPPRHFRFIRLHFVHETAYFLENRLIILSVPYYNVSAQNSCRWPCDVCRAHVPLAVPRSSTGRSFSWFALSNLRDRYVTSRRCKIVRVLRPACSVRL